MWLQVVWIQLLSRGATVACSGHVVGPVGSTGWSFGALIGIGGWGGTAGFGSGFFLLRGQSSLTERRRPNCCSLETPTGLNDGVDNYGKNRRTLMNTPGQTRFTSDYNTYLVPDTSNINNTVKTTSKAKLVTQIPKVHWRERGQGLQGQEFCLSLNVRNKNIHFYADDIVFYFYIIIEKNFVSLTICFNWC